jgi:hypothetical protein
MHPRLKNIVFHKLNKDLSKCEIILAENQSIWFIDRDRKYWYFELEKCGKLWWRYEFFTEFFTFFSLEHTSFQRLLSQWVEGILNRKVVRINENHQGSPLWMEGILSREVVATVEMGNAWSGVTEGVLNHGYRKGSRKVEEALNHSENTNIGGRYNKPRRVDEVLNHGVKKTDNFYGERSSKIEEVLNREINEIDGGELFDNGAIDKILNRSVESSAFLEGEFVPVIENVLNNQVVSTEHGFQTIPHQINKVLKTLPDLNSQLSKVDVILNQKS